ncbi:nitrophenyl compound nitroreductase subunit ArsF family protein [Tamlana sp. 2_MG-2023]|uniref:nitrophenyl compound nitroreductase subunit ArsF family protein n=1 Tax=unclassified Tamlana TaxID=2614803 RepID=UPI0026E2F56B|nr:MULTISPECIES: nitrophenyl compound nitroreductase subunit ArsF family protein [unclassified Tamlana]MDO6758876.1 nitrophenyl compound nitroreductase subunit ArsF family protein [Tamlana sp. 2_MG-2023]MDO6789575.1 nitrophenyl compound nitroreductase subunit ArsF family protein [Tamlana sp. 1_MG-2023]
MYKNIKILVVLALGFFLSACNHQPKKELTSLDQSVSKIEVIDFHSTNRCMTCNAIEANTRYTLNTYFSKALQEDKIELKVINIDDEINSNIVNKFEASGTSLFLNVIINGKEAQMDLTQFAFMNGNDQADFSKGLKAKIDAELKKL